MEKKTNSPYAFKRVQDLRFSDDFMFGAVMKDEHICRGVVERLLHISVARIEYPELQKSIAPYYGRKGIRLDVYVEDGGRVFDLEMQTYSQPAVGRRMRYYQSMLDIDSLMRGADYSALKESYILFLCRNDPFGRGLPVYTFERTCGEDGGVPLGDGTHHIVFNGGAVEKEPEPELRALLRYITSGEAESEFTREIEKMVETKKFEQTFINEYLAWNLHDRDVEQRGLARGITQGITQGVVQGKREGVVQSLKNLMGNLGWSLPQAMDALGIPGEERGQYAELLS